MSPRLSGYRERLYVNYFDAMKLLTANETYHRLFGNANIGIRHLTNMHIAGQIPYDAAFVIANVYTRTNIARPRPILEDAKHEEVQKLFAAGHSGDAIGTLLRELQWDQSPLSRALEEWAHTAMVTVIVGDKPMLELCFRDLMDGPALGPSHVPLMKKKDERGSPADFTKAKAIGSQRDSDEVENLPWRKQLGRCIIVPVRQNLSVQITSPEAPARALKHLATEAGILPEPLAWVHLEGLTTRDVY